jgi:hypothetical protein
MIVPTVGSGGPWFPANQDTNFALAASEIVDAGIARGRTKLGIDLFRSPGGNIVRGLDLLKLFFPSRFSYTGTLMRRHEATDLLATVIHNLNVTKVRSNLVPTLGV